MTTAVRTTNKRSGDYSALVHGRGIVLGILADGQWHYKHELATAICQHVRPEALAQFGRDHWRRINKKLVAGGHDCPLTGDDLLRRAASYVMLNVASEPVRKHEWQRQGDHDESQYRLNPDYGKPKTIPEIVGGKPTIASILRKLGYSRDVAGTNTKPKGQYRHWSKTVGVGTTVECRIMKHEHADYKWSFEYDFVRYDGCHHHCEVRLMEDKLAELVPRLEIEASNIHRAMAEKWRGDRNGATK